IDNAGQNVELLRKFREEINKLAHIYCSICNERFSLIKLCVIIIAIMIRIRQNKFYSENSMDPDDVPEERGLIDCSDFSNRFNILSSRGQHVYRGNVINVINFS